MTVLVKKNVFLHVPKTGGNWVREALRRSFPEDFVFILFPNNDPHIPIARLRLLFSDHSLAKDFLFMRNGQAALSDEEKLELLRSFSAEHQPRYHSFVRHPLSWWTSFWMYRQKMGWQREHWINVSCRSDNFIVFIENVLQKIPGSCSRMTRSFIGAGDLLIDRVGKQENLVEDLIEILQHENLPYNEKLIRGIPPKNTTEKRRPYLPDQLAARLLQSESDLINAFYPKIDGLAEEETQFFSNEAR